MPNNTVQDRSILAGLSRVRKALQAALQWFSGDPTATATGARGSVLDVWFRNNLTATQTGDTLIVDATGGGGSGTVTDFTAGNLSPLFTTNVATSTTTPDLTFAQVNQNANLVFAGPSTGAAAAPTFRAIVSADLPAISTVKNPGCGFDNGSLPITGTLTRSVQIPYGGTITDWTIVGDQTGSVSIVVSHATYAAYDTMTTLFTATCTSAKKAQGTGLSHAVSAGDILRFSASSFSNFTNCTITLKIT